MATGDTDSTRCHTELPRHCLDYSFSWVELSVTEFLNFPFSFLDNVECAVGVSKRNKC